MTDQDWEDAYYASVDREMREEIYRQADLEDAAEMNNDEDPDYEQRGEFCPECGGTGLDRWESFRPCEYCGGEGYAWW